MLKNIINLMKNFDCRRLPSVRVALHDLEKEQRDEMSPFGLLKSNSCTPLGLEFRFEAFNAAREKVCFGKIDHIPRKQVTVRMIETDLAHRRKRYATSVVLELSRLFGGIPVVPMDERSAGIRFWAALRERSNTADLVKAQISLTDASQLLRQAAASTKSNL